MTPKNWTESSCFISASPKCVEILLALKSVFPLAAATLWQLTKIWVRQKACFIFCPYFWALSWDSCLGLFWVTLNLKEEVLFLPSMKKVSESEGNINFQICGLLKCKHSSDSLKKQKANLLKLYCVEIGGLWLSDLLWNKFEVEGKFKNFDDTKK